MTTLDGSAANGAADTLVGTPKHERTTVPPQTRPLSPAGSRQPLSTLTVTSLSLLVLALFAYASPSTLRTIAATSIAWMVAYWFVFMRRSAR